MKHLKAYKTLIRAGILETLQFRSSIFTVIGGNIVYLIVIYNVWRSIFNSSPSDTVNGMTFADTMIYLVLATALFNFMEMFLVWDMGRSIQSGNIVLDLLKPMAYEKYKYFSFAGNWVTKFFTTFLPTFIIVEIITNFAVPLKLNMLWFAISVILGNLINFYIDFIIGTVCLYSQSIWGINIMKQVIVLFLSGATVPLAFFPDGFRRVLTILPFSSIYNTPLTFLSSNSPDLLSSLKLICFQFVWVVIMFCISKLFWNKSIKVITVNGG